jgi:hypothetical protein
MWLIDFCHRRSTECIEMAESYGDSDTERRKAWLDLAKQWSRSQKKQCCGKQARQQSFRP